MSNEVNKIQVNRNYQVNGAGSQPKENTNDKETKNEVSNKQTQATQVSASEVLSYMANQAVDIRPKQVEKVLDISKYVTPEQAERIAGFIGDFQKVFSDYADKIENELGNEILSDDAKTSLALEMLKADDMGEVSIDKEEMQKAQMEKLPDVSKYVTPAQAKRIGGFINQFEDIIVQRLQEFDQELGEGTISKEAKMDLAIELFNVRNFG